MNCHNHPNAPAIAICQRCTAEICGPCIRYLDAREYCEKCAETILAESFVAARTKQLERRREAQGSAKITKVSAPGARVTVRKPKPMASTAAVMETSTSTLANLRSSTSKRRAREETFLWLGFGGSSAMIFVALVIYAFPMLFQFDRAVAEEWETYQALEDCRLVFEEIGYLLEQGQVPDDTVRCAETFAPNIVERVGKQVRISHPNPARYGLRELYVTSRSHEVIFVESRELGARGP